MGEFSWHYACCARSKISSFDFLQYIFRLLHTICWWRHHKSLKSRCCDKIGLNMTDNFVPRRLMSDCSLSWFVFCYFPTIDATIRSPVHLCMCVKVCLRLHVLIVNYEHYYYYWFQCMVTESICVCILQHYHALLQAIAGNAGLTLQAARPPVQCTECSAVFVTLHYSAVYSWKLHCTALQLLTCCRHCCGPQGV